MGGVLGDRIKSIINRKITSKIYICFFVIVCQGVVCILCIFTIIAFSVRVLMIR